MKLPKLNISALSNKFSIDGFYSTKDTSMHEMTECLYDFESRFLGSKQIAFVYNEKIGRYITPLHISIVNLMDIFNLHWRWFTQTSKGSVVDVFENYNSDYALVDYQLGNLPFENGTKIPVFVINQIDHINVHGMVLQENFSSSFGEFIRRYPNNKPDEVFEELYYYVSDPVWQSYIK